jgi:cell division protein FtsW (lipid II flippase)
MIQQLQPKEISWRERMLLLLAAAFISINQVSLVLIRGQNVLGLWPLPIWAVCAIALHLLLKRRLPYRDPYLLPIMLLLVGWSLNLIDRLLPSFADRQAAWLIISSAALMILVYFPLNLRWLRRYRYTWLIAGLGLLGITILLGVNPSGRGPQLWLGFGNIFYQPSEILKILLIVFMASYLSDHWISLRHELMSLGPLRIPSISFLAPILLMWGLCVVILVWQRDLGTATIFFVVFMLMLYLASGQGLLLLAGSALLLLAGIAGYLMFEVVALRVDIWLNPWPESEGRAFQIVQSIMAVSAGGILGEGIGQGIPTFIPVVHSDFVFAAVAEEWGLIGMLGLLAALATIIFRGLRIAVHNQSRPFVSFLAAGLSLMLGIQTILIVGGTLRLLPLTGVTLPFLSYGGSSLLTNFIIIGLLLIMSEDTP